MVQALSPDLRVWVAAALRHGSSVREAAKGFDVSATSAVRIGQRAHAGRRLAPGKMGAIAGESSSALGRLSATVLPPNRMGRCVRLLPQRRHDNSRQGLSACGDDLSCSPIRTQPRHGGHAILSGESGQILNRGFCPN